MNAGRYESNLVICTQILSIFIMTDFGHIRHTFGWWAFFFERVCLEGSLFGPKAQYVTSLGMGLVGWCNHFLADATH